MCRADGEKMAVIMFMGDKCSERSSRESAPVSATPLPTFFTTYLTSYFLHVSYNTQNFPSHIVQDMHHHI